MVWVRFIGGHADGTTVDLDKHSLFKKNGIGNYRIKRDGLGFPEYTRQGCLKVVYVGQAKQEGN